MNKQEIQDRADSFCFPLMPQGLHMCISGFSSSAALAPKSAVSCLMEDLEERGREKKMRKEKKGREDVKQKSYLPPQKADPFWDVREE